MHPSLVQKQTSPSAFSTTPGYDLPLTFSHLVSDELTQLRITPSILISVPSPAQQSSMLPLLTVGPEFTRPACRVAAAAVIDRYQLRAPKQGRVQGGLGMAKPSQPLKLAPPPIKHDGRSSATYKLPQKIFACWRFSHSRAGAAISRTLALLNSAGTNFIN